MGCDVCLFFCLPDFALTINIAGEKHIDRVLRTIGFNHVFKIVSREMVCITRHGNLVSLSYSVCGRK